VKIQIREGGLGIAVAERSHVEDRLTVTLARFSERIAKVVVRLSSAETTTGAIEKKCRIEVEIRPETLHVDDRDAKLMTALDRATDRVGRAVARALERHRD
jgi:putative sigma-54 modulation protein